MRKLKLRVKAGAANMVLDDVLESATRLAVRRAWKHQDSSPDEALVDLLVGKMLDAWDEILNDLGLELI